MEVKEKEENTLKSNSSSKSIDHKITEDKDTFIPRDPSYSVFLNRLTQERQKLLEVAVKFLINPRVINTSSEDKTAFLKKKGLNDEEIYWVKQEANGRHSNTSLVPSSPPPRPPPMSLVSPSPSRSYTWGQIAVRGVAVGTMVGILVYWIKDMVTKWVNNSRLQLERQETLETQVLDIKSTLETTVMELKQSNLTIQSLLETQTRELSRISSLEKKSSTVETENALQTINTELSTVKGLLLNRHQFPTPQKDNPTGIPSWQRQSNTPNSQTNDSNDTIPVLTNGENEDNN